MKVRKPNGEIAYVSPKAFRLVYKGKGFRPYVKEEFEYTVAEIKEILDEKGIEYDSRAKKKELLALLKG